MKKHKKQAFTLVELIIVITILAILATIAFISFKNYSGNARDSNRLATIKNIQSGLELFSVKTGNYPDPESMVEIIGNGVTLKQGIFGENLQQTIKINGKIQDPLDLGRYIYSTNLKNTKYQLGTYLEENNLVGYFPQTYASNFDYSKRYFYTSGHKIGILLEEDNAPILKEKYSTGLNLEGNSNSFKVYFSNDNNSGSYVGNGDQLTQKIVDVQNQTSSGEDEGGEPDAPSEPVYDCNNVTNESYFTFSNGEITGYNQASGGLDVIIPCTINGQVVTSIGISSGKTYALAFKGLTSIKFPPTMTSIGAQAFLDNDLTTLEIPDSVINLGTQAFSTNKLTTVKLSKNLTNIGVGVFESNQLTSFSIPKGIVSIGNSAFQRNDIITLEFPDTLRTIGNTAFSENKLTSIVFSNGITSIGNSTFQKNSLTNIVFPNSLQSIGSQAFQSNTLIQVVIPNTISSIGISAFNLNGPSKNSGNITDWTSGNGGTWNISGTNWIKQN